MKTGILDGRSGYPELNSRAASANTCPHCNGPVRRIHRRLPERLLSLFHDVRRYRCPSESCGWRGLLGAPKASLWSSAARRPTVWAIAGVLALLLVAAFWLAYAYYERARAPEQPSAQQLQMPAAQVADTEPIGGRPLAADDPRRIGSSPLGEPLRGCVWGGAGQRPYVGTMTTALTAAQLPADIVTKMTIMRDGGAVSDRLEITSAGIHSVDYQRDFGYTVKAITMDGSICFDSKINPPSSSTGTADLYELVDAKRQRYAVMVVANGGNVAVLEMPGGR